MKLKIVALCPGGAVTGGPEALHQLVDMTNRVLPGSSAICYMPDESEHVTPAPYTKYNTPIVKLKDVPPDAVIVVPELWPFMVRSLDNPCALWWLSVDNFVCGDPSVVFEYKYHLTQSAYAYDHVSSVFNQFPIMLTDYIYINDFPKLEPVRNGNVLVNPSKGIDLIREFEKLSKGINVVHLQGLSRSGVISELSKSSAYIDFGHHPGKDRLPREASIAGCVVAMREIGAAAVYEDSPIGVGYKFTNVFDIIELVGDMVENHEVHLSAQSAYRENVLMQESIFESEVRNFLDVF